MVKKLTGKAGMTLVEMLASVLILVMLVVGMNAGMNAGLRVYRDSKAVTERSMLSSGINTKLTDILRYAQVKTVTVDGEEEHLITNLEYGLWDVTFEEDEDGIVQVCFRDKTGKPTGKETPLINTGNYSGFAVQDLSVEPETDDKGTYFTIRYTLVNTVDDSSTDEIHAVVRVMNE